MKTTSLQNIRALDPHSFYGDPDTDPAIFQNAAQVPDPDPDPGLGPAEQNWKNINHETFS